MEHTKLKKYMKRVAYVAICMLLGYLAANGFHSWYIKTYYPSKVPPASAEVEYEASATEIFDQYAGSVTFLTQTDQETTLYVYYEIVSIYTKTRKDESVWKEYTYNLSVQDEKENPTKTYECGGVVSQQADDPENVTYENYYPQFIGKKDVGLASRLYRELYDDTATVIAWDNAMEDLEIDADNNGQ